MCQVTPFTLPCCRRTYVAVLRLPSCPGNWPKSKCPPELCIQLFYEPEDRETGMCWRCKAHHNGVRQDLRERLRPGIDSADVVVGLEELNSNDRRRIAEGNGNCWFCGSKDDCQVCKTADIEGEVEENAISRTGLAKGKNRMANIDLATSNKARLVNKRLKIEGSSRARSLRSHTQTTLSKIRDEAQWQPGVPGFQNDYPQTRPRTSTTEAGYLDTYPPSTFSTDAPSSTYGVDQYPNTYSIPPYSTNPVPHQVSTAKIDPALLHQTQDSLPGTDNPRRSVSYERYPQTQKYGDPERLGDLDGVSLAQEYQPFYEWPTEWDTAFHAGDASDIDENSSSLATDKGTHFQNGEVSTQKYTYPSPT